MTWGTSGGQFYHRGYLKVHLELTQWVLPPSQSCFLFDFLCWTNGAAKLKMKKKKCQLIFWHGVYQGVNLMVEGIWRYCWNCHGMYYYHLSPIFYMTSSARVMVPEIWTWKKLKQISINFLTWGTSGGKFHGILKYH